MSIINLQKYKGVGFAFLSMFLGCMATIFYKPIMLQGVSPTVIGLIESGLLTILLLYSRPWRLLKSNKRIVQPIILASVLQAIGSISFIFGLHFLDPVTFSFLNRNQALFSIILGYFFLQERHNLATWIYITTAIVGSILLCYADMDSMNLIGVLFALMFCISFSLRNFVMRKHKRMPAMVNIFCGNLFTLAFIGVFALYDPASVSTLPEVNVLMTLSIVALVAIFGALYFYQLAFRFEKLSVISPVRLFSPFVVTIYFGWEIGYNFPALKMVGILIMTFSCLTLLYSYRTLGSVEIQQPALEQN
ncbi:MAG TPA: DMT family transporter [Gammaproteobacteria bacterium]|nr:DMT family transporter [Gammaproteobacteria bacterium]